MKPSFLQNTKRALSAVALAFLLSAFTQTQLTLISAVNADGRPDFDRYHPAVRAAVDVQNWHSEQLMRVPGVIGTGVGLAPDGTPIIKLFTQRAGIPDLPKELAGIPVRVEMTGTVFALTDTTARFPRPVPIGVSAGHPDITAGTIGARVKDSAGNLYALSNNHVFADSNQARINRDSITQPGSFDGGTLPDDELGKLADFVPIDFQGGSNYVDAALATIDPAKLGTATVTEGYGTPSEITRLAALNLPVQKCGRTTGCTAGVVEEINVSINVCYDGTILVCTKVARFEDQIGISPGEFSAGGDSGSLIVTDDMDRNPVALLFAGSSSRTFANPIDIVLSSFAVSIDGSTGTGSPVPPGEEEPINIALSATGYKVKGRHNVDLEWSGAGGSSVEVWRNEALIESVDNNGIYTDSTDNRGGGSYSYQICEADSSNCSDVVTVAF